MLCPKCHVVGDGRFCPQCGLDHQIYLELAALREEIASLREIVLSGTSPKREIIASLPGAKVPNLEERGATPPPLPLSTSKATGKKKISGGSSAEVAVGQKWVLGIGVLILVIGIGFFLKYAFDQQWIGPEVRISIGFAAGLALLAGGDACHRRDLRGLDIGLGAVGLGTLYLTSYAACQVDRLIPGTMALALILITTAIGASLAALWGSQILAVLTFLTGYLAPLLFDSKGLLPWLFLAYLFILTLGGQVLAYAKGWRHLYSSGAALTWLSLALWAQRGYRRDWFLETFVFTQVLFLAYSIMPFLRAAFRKEFNSTQGFLLAVVNGLLCCWYSESLLNYQKSSGSLVSLSYAIFTLGLALIFWQGRTRGVLSSWLIAQGIVFLLVFGEQILTGSWLTVFWSAELVALYWAAAKSDDRTLLSGTFLIGPLLMFQFFWNTIDLVVESSNSILFTDGFTERWSAGLSMVVGLLLVAWLDRNRFFGRDHPLINRGFELLGIVSLFGFTNLELLRLTNQFMRRMELVGFSVLWSIFAVCLMLAGVWMRRKAYRLAAMGLLTLTVVKVLAVDTAEVSTPYRILSCLVLGAILVAVSFLYYRFSERLIDKLR
jgi:uncharacterized membrane protein